MALPGGAGYYYRKNVPAAGNSFQDILRHYGFSGFLF